MRDVNSWVLSKFQRAFPTTDILDNERHFDSWLEVILTSVIDNLPEFMLNYIVEL